MAGDGVSGGRGNVTGEVDGYVDCGVGDDGDGDISG